MLLKRNKEMIHFSGRRHTKMGIASTVIGIAVMFGFLSIIIASAVARGKGSALLGSLGILLLGISIFGFVLSYKAFKKRDVFYLFPILGAVLNSFMAILLLIIYIFGFGI